MSENIFIKKIAEEKIFGAYEITYSLYEISLLGGKRYYAAEISCGEDSEFQVVGSDIEDSKRLFYTLFRSNTTPVTLCEIISDKFQAMKY